uniref:Envelope glycoprotein n=1 Tax=Catagonus wagneri TaxID=51154 RepID=A0A8C3YFX3_9CETA
MENPALSKPSQDKTYPRGLLIIICTLLRLGMTTREGNPHQVYSMTWQVQSQTGEIVWKTQGNHANPDNLTDGEEIVRQYKDWFRAPPETPGCKSPPARCALAQKDFYVCPRDNRDRNTAYKCGGYENYFCAAWGCETTGDAYWQPSSSWDLITVKRNYTQPSDCHQPGGQEGKWKNPLSLPLKITFTKKGQQATGWQTGYTWGLRWYLQGKDEGVTFKIKLKVNTITHSIGSNPILKDQKPPSQLTPKMALTTPYMLTSSPNTTGKTDQTPQPHQPGTGDRLLTLLQGAYLALNLTDPNKTQECWLCLVSRPPYYEGIAILGDYINQTSVPTRCTSTSQHKLTLSEVSGRGRCIGTIPRTHQALCNSTEEVRVSPTKDTLWGLSLENLMHYAKQFLLLEIYLWVVLSKVCTRNFTAV